LLVDFQSLLLFFLVCHASSIAEILGPVNLIHFTKRKEPKIIFIFDNDTAGVKAINRCKRVAKPNLRLMKLPNLEEFQKFQTLGPNGQTEENINNRAVSIELFLDLSSKNGKKPEIRWTSYDEQMGQYQGELISKDKYTKMFIEAYNKRETNYALEKLTILLNNILEEAKHFL